MGGREFDKTLELGKLFFCKISGDNDCDCGTNDQEEFTWLPFNMAVLISYYSECMCMLSIAEYSVIQCTH